MDDAEMRPSTLPPQCGHFFRCGPETVSIFSVKRPHFRHLYSYKGTDGLLLMVESKSISRVRQPLSRRVLDFQLCPRSALRTTPTTVRRPRHRMGLRRAAVVSTS